MNKEVISDSQAISLTTLAIIGTSVIIVMGLDAKKDLWLANILSILMSLPMIIIFAHLHYIFPGKDLFDILDICFGKLLGKGISILYIWFAFHIGTLITNDFGQFITIVSMPNTPKVIPITAIILLGIWAVKEGIEVLGRWSNFFAPIIIIFIFATTLLSIPNMNINNIRPVLYNGIKPVIKGAFYSFAFPFVETVILTMFFTNFETKKSPYKVYILSLIIGGIILVTLNLSSVLILGINTTLSLYYPTYSAIGRINIGDIFQRVEAIAAAIFVLGGYIKMSICLLATCKGIAKFFDYTDYKFIVTPVALLMGNFSFFIYDNTMELIKFASTVSPYYKFPFQVILPILILVIAQIKKKRGKIQF
ncbi:GerAB/ArcD/ProY family transporter [Crassaminicella profunda]|uniref:GerAB/ArcD/ProY family transporter n=1 Tax=Crassaminicella profunda TaxID=1286698 RepID=UPI001CA7AC3C|nr:endospore germination permease [Crassaminicella profunda]QZY53771.1 endospore germination permease [Crassaminicella profunda]